MLGRTRSEDATVSHYTMTIDGKAVVAEGGLPFGGAKWSGIGVENGPRGLLGFTEIQTVNIAK